MSEETEVIKETAKAAQEVAKTSGQAIESANKFGAFIARFISGSLEQGMGIVEDKLKYTRWENRQKLMSRAEKVMRENGLREPTKPLPMKFAIPLFQAASLEDDSELQDLWAKLLVNSSTEASGVSLNRIYIDILERISPLEAQILSAIYSLQEIEELQHQGVLTSELPYKALPIPEEEKNRAIDPSDDVKLALANLANIGCINTPRTIGGGEGFGWVNPTVLGESFYKACTLNKTSSEAS